jgi:hypothetical protein
VAPVQTVSLVEVDPEAQARVLHAATDLRL